MRIMNENNDNEIRNNKYNNNEIRNMTNDLFNISALFSQWQMTEKQKIFSEPVHYLVYTGFYY